MRIEPSLMDLGKILSGKGLKTIVEEVITSGPFTDKLCVYDPDLFNSILEYATEKINEFQCKPKDTIITEDVWKLVNDRVVIDDESRQIMNNVKVNKFTNLYDVLRFDVLYRDKELGIEVYDHLFFDSKEA